MPKLLIFAPCDNVLINKDAESASLIVILSGVRMPNAPDPLPEKALAPMRWFIFCQWLIEPEDIGVTFEQRLRFGSGFDFLDQSAEFTGEKDKYHHRMIAGLFGFPLLAPGIYSLHVDLRRKGAPEWNHIQSYPLEVTHA